MTASPLHFVPRGRLPDQEPGAAVEPIDDPAPRAGRSFPDRTTLTPRDRVILRAIAQAMFAEDDEVEVARLDAHLDEVDAYVSAASRPVRAGLRFALFVIRISPLLLLFSLRTIEKLAMADRVAVLTRLERSRIAPLSLAFIGWRTVMTLVFYEDAAELRSAGYASDERKVYKRRLAVMPVATVPVPEESGVRLRTIDDDADDADDDEKVA